MGIFEKLFEDLIRVEWGILVRLAWLRSRLLTRYSSQTGTAFVPEDLANGF